MLIDDFDHDQAPDVCDPDDTGPGYQPSLVEVVLFLAAVATAVVTLSPLWLPALDQALAPYPTREVVTEQVDR